MALPRLLKPSVIVRRNALYKGLFGGSRGWLAVGVVIWGRGAAKRFFGRTEEHLGTEVVKRGQFVRIEAFRPPTRKERRAARRAG